MWCYHDNHSLFSVGGLDKEGGVAQVVGLHDRRVQRGEIQRCYGNIVIPVRS